MIGEVMRFCNNFFEDACLVSTFAITEDGQLTPDVSIVSGQYVAISGSIFHNGVFQVIDGRLQGLPEGLPSESFFGRVWTLCPPVDFLAICGHIKEYSEKQEQANGGKASESFGGYSYSIATAGGGPMTWQEAYASQLRKYRKMFTEVSC